MSFRFRLTDREFAKIMLQMYYRKPLTWLVLILVPVYIGYAAMHIELDNVNQVLPLSILPIFVLFILPASVWFGAIRTYENTPPLSQETHVQVTDKQVLIETASKVVEHPRTDLRRVLNLVGAKVLVFGPGHLVPIPKRIIGPEEEAFLNSLKASLKK